MSKAKTIGGKPMDEQFWREECNYIARMTDRILAGERVSEMLSDRGVAIRYCEMQRDTAKSQGFDDAATYIQHCIDDLEYGASK